MATAGYSLVDGLGARVSGDAVTYVAWLFVFDVAIMVPACLALRGPGVFSANRRAWTLGALASLGSYAAYAIAVWAMTQAPIALVAALRETSILFAVLIGWILFGETDGPGQGDRCGPDHRRRGPDSALDRLVVGNWEHLLRNPCKDKVDRGQNQPPMRPALRIEIDPGRPAREEGPGECHRQVKVPASALSAPDG